MSPPCETPSPAAKRDPAPIAGPRGPSRPRRKSAAEDESEALLHFKAQEEEKIGARARTHPAHLDLPPPLPPALGSFAPAATRRAGPTLRLTAARGRRSGAVPGELGAQRPLQLPRPRVLPPQAPPAPVRPGRPDGRSGESRCPFSPSYLYPPTQPASP